VVAAGGGLLVDDSSFDAAWLRKHLLPLLADPARCEQMGRAAAGFGRLDADVKLASMVRAAAKR
jgi:UDP-N-acetylglucosamine--N-acetylmuramyl-(pentapeptide) pyrophosphoryl-undecaprenol N-acetylglucosamine transferase